MTVNQLLSVKEMVHSIVSTITVYDGLKNVGAVLVIEDLAKEFCLRDYARKLY
jgi:uncharacterized membrane protein